MTFTLSFAPGDGIQVTEDVAYSLDGKSYTCISFLNPCTVLDGSKSWTLDITEEMWDKPNAKASMWSFAVYPRPGVAVMPEYHLKIEISRE